MGRASRALEAVDDAVDRDRAARPGDRHAVVAVQHGVAPSPTRTTEIGGSTVPRSSASQIALPALARGARRTGRKARVELRGAARLERAADRVERDLADRAGGAGAPATATLQKTARRAPRRRGAARAPARRGGSAAGDGEGVLGVDEADPVLNMPPVVELRPAPYIRHMPRISDTGPLSRGRRRPLLGQHLRTLRQDWTYVLITARRFRRSANQTPSNRRRARKTRLSVYRREAATEASWSDPSRKSAPCAGFVASGRTPAGFGGSEGGTDGARTGSEAGASYGVVRRGWCRGGFAGGSRRPVAADVR